MSLQGKHIMSSFLKRWQLFLVLEVLGYAVGVGVLSYFISANILLALVAFVVTSAISAFIIKPWQPGLNSVSRYIDSKLDTIEYSSGLLLTPYNNLSDLAKLQHLKITERLKDSIKLISPPHHLIRSSIIAAVLIVLGIAINQFGLMDSFNSGTKQHPSEELINFQSHDSITSSTKIPKITSQQVTVRYPAYTNVSQLNSSRMEIQALEGSQIFWQLQFDSEVDSVFIQSSGSNYLMKEQEGSYTWRTTARHSGFYNFRFKDTNGKTYTSDLYSIEVTQDAVPNIEIKGLKQFTSFNYDQKKLVNFNTTISDDFGIADTYIVATVSKGSGESVKFREEKLTFNNQIAKGSKTLKLSKTIDLDNLKMEPGDELYFYVEALDYKTPKSNYSRSETFFATVKDTTSYVFGVEGTLGVDRMPDYFRSQRQLIIDTEKLIAEKSKHTKEEFNFESNELGFDQKALRLKYGAFMGEENETGIEIETEAPAHEAEHDSENPLEGYMHDHDSENEHNLVPEKEQGKDDKAKNPLEEYMHNHDDPEKATLFEESLRVKLHKALAQMWDAELYLRLYEPHKSLPYQYRALELIQEIKNTARIYVHRIGFDPPPIKEDKRLTGELEDVSSYRKQEDITREELYPFMKQSIVRLEQLKSQINDVSEADKVLFENAGNELATLAIEFPGKYLNTLQQLKRITDGVLLTNETIKEIQKGLFMAIPRAGSNPSKYEQFQNELDKLLLKELGLYDE